jgi:hypothetical protein
MKWVIAALALALALVWFGWLGRWTYHWHEEVLLHDGRVIVVERSVKTGYVPVEIGQPPGESDYTLTFVASDGKSVTWEGGRDRFIPMILDFEQGVPYVVATGATSLVYGVEGCPRPPYFFFKWSAGSWQRVTYEEFPKSIRKANLSAGLTYPSRDPMRERIGRGELVTKEDVARLRRTADVDAKEVREDKPNPCATWANDFRYEPKK